MAKYFENISGKDFALALKFTGPVPVDTRFVVENLTDLTDPKTWVSGTYNETNDSANVYVVYAGLAVAVLSEKTVYVFTAKTADKTTVSNAANWTKLANGTAADSIAEDLEDLADLVGTAEDTSSDETVFGAIKKEEEDRKAAIAALDAEEEGEGDFVTVKVTQVDGVITKVEVSEENIASASDIANKVKNSATLKEGTSTWETAVSIKYVANAGSTPAHLALVDKAGTELSTIAVSDIIGNGVLKGHSYNSTTGKLTLTFAKADGTDATEEIDLGKMLDIDDVLIDANSKAYLDVDLTGAENSQAVFKALIVKMAEASTTKTGLADAYDVKKYVDDSIAAITLTAEGDDYVGAEVDEDNVITIETNIGTLTVATDGTITGTAKTLVDGKEIADKVTAALGNKIATLDAEKEGKGAGEKVKVKVTQVDGVITAVDVVETDIASAALLGTAADTKDQNTAFGKIAKEAADRAAAISGLNAEESGKGTNIEVSVTEEAGVITSVEVTETYATVTRVAKEGTTPASLTVANGTGLVKGSDIEALKGYVDDKASEVRFEKGTGTNSAILKGTGVTATNEGEVAVGKNNNSSTGTETSAKTLFSVGNGASASAKSNAFEVRENGDLWINLGSDYQKLQTILSNEIDWYEGD